MLLADTDSDTKVQHQYRAGKSNGGWSRLDKVEIYLSPTFTADCDWLVKVTSQSQFAYGIFSSAENVNFTVWILLATIEPRGLGTPPGTSCITGGSEFDGYHEDAYPVQNRYWWSSCSWLGGCNAVLCPIFYSIRTKHSSSWWWSYPRCNCPTISCKSSGYTSQFQLWDDEWRIYVLMDGTSSRRQRWKRNRNLGSYETEIVLHSRPVEKYSRKLMLVGKNMILMVESWRRTSYSNGQKKNMHTGMMRPGRRCSSYRRIILLGRNMYRLACVS